LLLVPTHVSQLAAIQTAYHAQLLHAYQDVTANEVISEMQAEDAFQEQDVLKVATNYFA
jgi:cytochrome c553